LTDKPACAGSAGRRQRGEVEKGEAEGTAIVGEEVRPQTLWDVFCSGDRRQAGGDTGKQRGSCHFI